MSVKMPKYCLNKRSGLAYFDVKRKRTYLGKYGTPESMRLYQDAMAALQKMQVFTASYELGDAPVSLLILRYTDHIVAAFPPPSSVPDYTKAALQTVTEHFRRVTVNNFGPKTLEQCRQMWIRQGKARETVNKYTAVVQRMFRWGVSQELVPTETWQALTSLSLLRKGRSQAPEPKKRREVSEAEFTETLAFLPPALQAALWVMRLNGARPDEILKLRPCDIDRTHEVWLCDLAEHKTAYRGKRRFLLFGPKAQAHLMPLMDRAPDAYLFDPRESYWQRRKAAAPDATGRREGQPETRRKTARRMGERYNSRALYTAIQRAIEAANGKRAERDLPPIASWSPYCNRHHAAQDIRDTFGKEAAAELLGHERLETTEIYSNPGIQKAMAAMREVG